MSSHLAELYKTVSPEPWEAYDSSGDGLLFACLLAVGKNQEFPIELAIGNDGQLFRNPTLKQSGRMALGPRDSTISRDMLMGFLIYCLHFRRLDLVNQTLGYAIRHWGKMGEERRVHTITKFGFTFRIKDNRTFLTPGLFILMLAIRAFLRGRVGVAKFLVSLPQIYSIAPGYVSHLTMLHLYLNRRIRGSLFRSEETVLHKIQDHSSTNPLASAILGARIATKYYCRPWPRDRLPSASDWSEEWRTQRADADSGLLPGVFGNHKIHSGGDLLFVLHTLDLTAPVLEDL